MSRTLEVHTAVQVSVTFEDDGTVTYGKPYQCDENPWMYGDECVWDVDDEQWSRIRDWEDIDADRKANGVTDEDGPKIAPALYDAFNVVTTALDDGTRNWDQEGAR